tara:strand:+ start:236 stop:496 length:261 start_codon:yes stop_codon:yes gene_type:complete
VRAEVGLGADEPCDVACADAIWIALIEIDSPPTVLVLSRCVSCFSSSGLPPTPPMMIRGRRLRVAPFEMPCAEKLFSGSSVLTCDE